MFVTIVQGSVSQLLNQSFYQSVRHPIAQSVSQLLNQSFRQPVRHLVSQSVSQSLSQSFCQPVKYSTAQSVSQSVTPLVSIWYCKLLIQSAIQSVINQSFYQPVSLLQVDSQPVSKLFSQSVKMVNSWLVWSILSKLISQTDSQSVSWSDSHFMKL